MTTFKAIDLSDEQRVNLEIKLTEVLNMLLQIARDNSVKFGLKGNDQRMYLDELVIRTMSLILQHHFEELQRWTKESANEESAHSSVAY